MHGIGLGRVGDPEVIARLVWRSLPQGTLLVLKLTPVVDPSHQLQNASLDTTSLKKTEATIER